MSEHLAIPHDRTTLDTLVVQSQGALVVNQIVSSDGKFLAVRTAGDRLKTDLYEHIQEVHDEVLEYGKLDSEVFDTAGVNNFIKRHGLTPPKCMIFEEHQRAALANTIFAGESYFNGETHGAYLHNLDLAVVIRNKELESVNGLLWLEYSTAHEKLHGAHDYKMWNVKVSPDPDENGTFWTPRSGFITNQPATKDTELVAQGFFLEEGYVDYMAVKYLEEKTGQVCPPMLSANGREWYGLPTLPGRAIRALVNTLPDFEESLIEARKSPAGLQKISQQLNTLEPSLYKKLMSLQPNYDDFYDGYSIIMNALR